MARSHYVYIMSSKSGVLYIGSRNDLERGVFEHKHGLVDGFTRKYRVTRLVCFEEFEGPAEMVSERQLKGWTRRRKLALIHTQNPEMVDYARRAARDPSLRPGGSCAFGSGWPQRPPRLRMTEGAAVLSTQDTRVQSGGHPLRVFYAFDPRRRAVLLLGETTPGMTGSMKHSSRTLSRYGPSTWPVWRRRREDEDKTVA